MAEFLPGKQSTIKGRKIAADDLQRGKAIVASKAAFVIEGFGIQKLKTVIFPTQEDPSAGTNIGVSALGTPVFNDVTFNGGQYLPLDGGPAIAYDQLQIDTVLFEVTQTKNIVKTVLNGRNGTVKEFISSGDYDITLRGVITSGSTDVYPEDKIEALKNIFEIPEAIKIYSDFLQIFGIDEVVIESFAFPQREGFNDMQLFTAKLTQDIPVILTT